jgi:2'-5' RNA ligase
MPPPPKRDVARLFFAIAPQRELRERLANLAQIVARATGGRPVPADNLHVTLAFLGEVARERIESLRAIGDALPRVGFALELNSLGAFPRTGVAWVAPTATSPELAALQSYLAERLAASGFPIEARPFHAHITLARRSVRRVQKVALPVERWVVDRVSLFESTPGERAPRYVEIAGWPLG